jgi:hypothetical protein
MQASSGILHFVEVFDSVVGELKALQRERHRQSLLKAFWAAATADSTSESPPP